jgi:hypothetical protein
VIVHEYADDKGTAPSPKRARARRDAHDCAVLSVSAQFAWAVEHDAVWRRLPLYVHWPEHVRVVHALDVAVECSVRHYCADPFNGESSGRPDDIAAAANDAADRNRAHHRHTRAHCWCTVGSNADSSAATAAVGESSAPFEMSSTHFSTSLEATAAIMTPAVPQSPTDNSALIGGIVGAGIVALLLVCGLTAFSMARNQTKEQEHDGSRSESAPSQSNYGRIPAASSNYGESAIVVPHRDHYDSLTAEEI